MSDVRFRFKLVLVGEGAVGKTSIRQKYMGKGFTGEYLKTIGADFASKVVEMKDKNGETIKSIFQIWDLAGQQEFKEVRASFYGGCQGVLLVFDLTKKESMDKLKDWILEAAKNAGGAIKSFCLIGNKCDLPNREVSKEEGLEFAKYLSERLKFIIPYIETSAKTGDNIEYLFQSLCYNLLTKEGFDIQEVAKPGEKAPPPAIKEAKEVKEVEKVEEIVLPAVPVPSEEPEIPEIPAPSVAVDTELADRVSKLEQRISKIEESLTKMAKVIKDLIK